MSISSKAKKNNISARTNAVRYFLACKVIIINHNFKKKANCIIRFVTSVNGTKKFYILANIFSQTDGQKHQKI